MLFPCNYLDGNVELTEERAGHIAERHPELLPEHRSLIEETLAAPLIKSAAVSALAVQNCSPAGMLIFATASTLLWWL